MFPFPLEKTRILSIAAKATDQPLVFTKRVCRAGASLPRLSRAASVQCYRKWITLCKISARHSWAFLELREGKRKGNCLAAVKPGSRLQLLKQRCLLAMPSATQQNGSPFSCQVNLQRTEYILGTKPCLFHPEWSCSYAAEGVRWLGNPAHTAEHFLVVGNKPESHVSTSQTTLLWTPCLSRFSCVVRPTIPQSPLWSFIGLCSVSVSLWKWEAQHRPQQSWCTSPVLSRGEGSPPTSSRQSSVWREFIIFFKSFCVIYQDS